MTASVRDRVEKVTRASYGRLLALLSAPHGDIAAAEDALSDAFEKALRRWPAEGIPANPEAWLLTVARNRLRDRWKSSSYRMTTPLAGADDPPDPGAELDADTDGLPDRRLELLLVCAHPAISADVRAPLMLQAVLGLDAAVIAAAFAVPPATMAQRLVRAKRRIRDARIPFAIPARGDLAERLPAVLEAVYGACAVDWAGGEPGPESLTAEALHLALLLADLLPDEPEVLGGADVLHRRPTARAPRRLRAARLPGRPAVGRRAHRTR